jgi:hypothetical protein
MKFKIKRSFLDTGKTYSDIFPGQSLSYELAWVNALDAETKRLELFNTMLINKGFNKDIADYMTLLYFNATLPKK